MEALAAQLVGAGEEALAFGKVGPRKGEPTSADFHAVRAGLPFGTRGRRELKLGRAMRAAARQAQCDVTVGVRHLEEVDILWMHGGSHVATMEALYRARHDGELPIGGLRLRGRHRAFAALERRALEGGARRVVCPSNMVAKELGKRYPAAKERLVVAPSGVDLERFHPRERVRASHRLRQIARCPAHAPLIVLAARNPELKGFPAALAALAPLQHKPWHLLLAGVKRPGRWRQFAQRRGLAGRVTVSADVDPVELAAGADLCILPTWRDTFGLVILEALASGTPVLATQQAGASELLGDGPAGRSLDSPLARADWTRELSSVLDSIFTGIDPLAVRAAVAHRGHGPWLDQLVQLCREMGGKNP